MNIGVPVLWLRIPAVPSRSHSFSPHGITLICAYWCCCCCCSCIGIVKIFVGWLVAAVDVPVAGCVSVLDGVVVGVPYVLLLSFSFLFFLNLSLFPLVSSFCRRSFWLSVLLVLLLLRLCFDGVVHVVLAVLSVVIIVVDVVVGVDVLVPRESTCC